MRCGTLHMLRAHTAFDFLPTRHAARSSQTSSIHLSNPPTHEAAQLYHFAYVAVLSFIHTHTHTEHTHEHRRATCEFNTTTIQKSHKHTTPTLLPLQYNKHFRVFAPTHSMMTDGVSDFDILSRLVHPPPPPSL